MNPKFLEALNAAICLNTEDQDRLISEIRQHQRDSVVEQLRVGSVVRINHNKVSPSKQFRVTKINRKNIKCKEINGNMLYTVNPTLIEVIN